MPFIFRGELKPIFARLSSKELLHTCQKGLTQNQNEFLNNALWSKCSKRIFIGKDRFTLAVCESITSFNDGARGKKQLMERLKLIYRPNSGKALQLQNKFRLRNSRLKVTQKYRNRRQQLRSLRKIKGKDDKSYMAGSYSLDIIPDSGVPCIVPVTFVPHEHVQKTIIDFSV